METLRSGTILDSIMEAKKAEVSAARRGSSLTQVQRRAQAAPPPRDLAGALRTGKRIHLIAEVKKASPSKGVFREDFDPVRYIRAYDGSPASAMSILTDERFFQGSLQTLMTAIGMTDKPCLRKDFIFDEYQVWESRGWGADAILLIVAVLPSDRLKRLMSLAQELGMTSLVEVHTEAELSVAMESGASVVGINNRDLKTFEVDLNTTLRLRGRIPDAVTVVSESGIETREDVRRLEEAKVNAILVGESLIRSDAPRRKIAELLGEQHETGL